MTSPFERHRDIAERLRSDADNARIETPADLRDRILAALEEEPLPGAARGRGRYWPLALSVAAAVIVFFVLSNRMRSPVLDAPRAQPQGDLQVRAENPNAGSSRDSGNLVDLVPGRAVEGTLDGLLASGEFAVQAAVTRAVHNEVGKFSLNASRAAGAVAHGFMGAPTVLGRRGVLR